MFAGLSSKQPGPLIHEIGRSVGGTVYEAVVDEAGRRQAYSSIVVGADKQAISSVADFALFKVKVRQIRHQPRTWDLGEATPGVVATFGLIGRPGLTHDEVDDHWNTSHAPLALAHHPGMWHYHQISISEVVDGPAFDGIALCAFASRYDLSHRFFVDEHSRTVIKQDVSKFADTTNSPPRVLMTEYRYNPAD